MKHKILQPLQALLLPVLLATAAISIQAQVLSVETIGPFTLAPSSPSLALGFPNVYDPYHPKKLTFEGEITVLGQPGSGVQFWFGWVDETSTDPVTTPPRTLQPGEVFEEFWIPFCPSQVSIHFEMDPGSTSGGTYSIQGTFTHECIVPEPSTYAGIAGLGLIGFLVLRRWRGATRI